MRRDEVKTVDAPRVPTTPPPGAPTSSAEQGTAASPGTNANEATAGQPTPPQAAGDANPTPSLLETPTAPANSMSNLISSLRQQGDRRPPSRTATAEGTPGSQLVRVLPNLNSFVVPKSELAIGDPAKGIYPSWWNQSNDMLEQIAAQVIKSPTNLGGLDEPDARRLLMAFMSDNALAQLLAPELYFCNVQEVCARISRWQPPVTGWVTEPNGDRQLWLRDTLQGENQACYLAAVPRDGWSYGGDNGEFFSYVVIFPQTEYRYQLFTRGSNTPALDENGNQRWEYDSSDTPPLVIGIDVRLDRENVLRFAWSGKLYLRDADETQPQQAGQQRRRTETLLKNLGGSGFKNLEQRLRHCAQAAGFPLHLQRVNSATGAEIRQRQQQYRENRQNQNVFAHSATGGAGAPNQPSRPAAPRTAAQTNQTMFAD